MSNNKHAKYSNFQKTCEKMPKSKINHGPYSIYNCDKSSNDFRCLSNLAIRKAFAKGNLHFYPYLQPGYQICSPHYTAIVENQLPEPISMLAQAFIPTLLVKLSIGDQIKQMTSVLYTKRHDN
ncbi:46050_t:CDS:1, partial [Gigaspora margarita]